MKKKHIFKRLLSFVLILGMIGTLAMSLMMMPSAESGGEWSLFENFKITVANGNSFANYKTFKTQLPDTIEDKNRLQLRIVAEVNAEAADLLNRESVVEICNDSGCDTSEWTWNVNGMWVEGENDILLPFSKGHDGAGTKWTGPAFSIERAIVYFRMYSNQKCTGKGEILLKSVSVEYLEPWIDIAGDGSDTYLALSKNVDQDVATVELSMKMKPVQTEWPIWTSGNLQNVYYENNVSYRTLSEGEAPGKGARVADISVKAGNKFGLNLTGFTISAPGFCESLSDLALDFWISMTEGSEAFTFGQIELTSSGTCDVHEIYYDTQNLQLSAGWNHVVIPLDEFVVNKTTEPLDLKNINYLRWHTSTLQSGQAATVSLSGIKIVSLKEPDDNMSFTALWTGEDASDQLNLEVLGNGHPVFTWQGIRLEADQSVMTNEKTDLALVHDSASGTVKFYLNGSLKKEVSDGGKKGPKIDRILTIGARDDGSCQIEASVSNLRLWRSARTAAQTLSDCTKLALTGTEAGLIGAWDLDGNITNILKTLPDLVGTGEYGNNPVVFKGTRRDQWIDYTVPEEIGSDYYTLAYIPDPQNITIAVGIDKWEAITDWIADNYEKENIFHVLSAGDDTWSNDDRTWGVFVNGMSKFWEDVSWSSLIGNHDYVWSTDARDSRNFNKYVGLDAIYDTAASESFAGFYEEDGMTDKTSYVTYPSGVENAYYEFVINGTKWLLLQLEYHPRDSVLDWANEILEQYKDWNVILATHGYLMSPSGGYMTWIQQYMTDERNAGDAVTDTENVYKKVVEPNSNVKIVISGHSENPEENAVMSHNMRRKDGTVVYQYMINAQYLDTDDHTNYMYYDNQCVGMLGLCRFSKDGSKVAFNWYCPADDKTYEPIPEGSDPGTVLGASVNNRSNFVITLSEPKETKPQETEKPTETETLNEGPSETAEPEPIDEEPSEKGGCGSALGTTLGCIISSGVAAGAVLTIRKKKEGK
ncbi:MAG: metallophosphoesterase [Clostridia bacterium]|nr:metallophosphoesterase [Clostridia bacterium]